MEGNVRKYILIPEYRPLYAMRQAFGPSHGPLSKPTPTPLDIIGKLLKQRGNEALTVMEVKKLDDGSFSKPMQLTLDNYTMSYDEIAEGKTLNAGKAVMSDMEKKHDGKPNIIGSDTKAPEPPAPTSPKNMFAQIQAENNQAMENAMMSQIMSGATTAQTETGSEDKGEETPAAETSEEENGDANGEVEDNNDEAPAETPNPYAGMTKAQRRAARREAARKAAEESGETVPQADGEGNDESDPD